MALVTVGAINANTDIGGGLGKLRYWTGATAIWTQDKLVVVSTTGNDQGTFVIPTANVGWVKETKE